MRGPGCLLVMVLLAALTGELYLFLVVWHATADFLGPFLALIVLSIVGVKLIGFHLRRLPQDMMLGKAGTRMVGVVGAALVILPGFGTGAIGLLLQLPPLRRLLSGLGGRVASSLTRVMMRRMGAGGGMPPGMFPGGFPGAFGGMRPDDAARFRKPGKVIDTTAERVDDPPPGT